MATIDLGKIKMVWRGTYAGGTAYVPDDVVEYTDTAITSSYICTANSTGNAPSSGGTAHGSWAYLAKGAAGSPTTTRGDIIYRGASADARLAKGTSGQILTMGANDPAWGAAPSGTVKGWKYMSSTTGYSRANNSSWFEMPAYDLTYTPASADNFLLCTFTIALQNRYSSTGGSNASCAPKLSTDGGSSWAWAWSGFVCRNHSGHPANSYASATHTVTFVINCGNTNAHQIRWWGVTNTYSNTEAWFGRDVDGPSDDGQTNFQILELGPVQT